MMGAEWKSFAGEFKEISIFLLAVLLIRFSGHIKADVVCLWVMCYKLEEKLKEWVWKELTAKDLCIQLTQKHETKKNCSSIENGFWKEKHQ